MRKNKIIGLFAALLAVSGPLLGQTPATGQVDAQKEKRMEWFKEAKLGIFIHWGIYAVNGVSESWSFFNNYLPYEEYMKQAEGFTASKYDPKKWVDLIQESGARYAVITTKHHDGVALWNTKVQKVTVQLYDVETGKVAKDKSGATINGLPDGMHVVFMDKDGDDLFDVETNSYSGSTLAELGSADNIKKTTTIALRFENQQTLADALTLDHKYKAVITFVGTADAGGTNSTLSTTEIPFTLSIPTIDKLFTEQAGVFVGGVANAYMDVAAVSGRSVGATYPFASAFNKFGENMKATTFEFKMDDETKIVDDLTSADLATINDATNTDADITLNNTLGGTNLVDGNTGLQKGYKQELIVNVSAKFAGVWDYGTANDVDYSFKIKVMSPLYEGTIVATDQIVTIPATDVNGHEVNSSDIAGYTYNDILYSIFPDKAVSTVSLGYKRDEIQKVEFKSMDENVFTSNPTANAYTPANPTTETPAKDGYLVVYPKNLAETTDAKLKVTLTDAWGYKKVAEIPVRVTVGE